ncbi:unnamed protein product [Bursaphelenchus xylophilus]|uniref:(pine wood nematode) hypothetical protein n=1 Tax=Bursaphelenchus xylophilus TaxID=6326 RepID=A0A1I7RJE3_BURXY|nr:unnamed protein product [Bursaphelenchus xylophilus]CAG9128824.1 unnamed protein product [Bursaphelenchus xylophilus]
MRAYCILLLIIEALVEGQEPVSSTAAGLTNPENSGVNSVAPSEEALSTISPLPQLNDEVVDDNDILPESETSDIASNLAQNSVVEPIRSNTLTNTVVDQPEVPSSQNGQQNQFGNLAVPRLNGQAMMFPPGMICYCCRINCSPNGVPQYQPVPAPAAGEWSQWGEWSACEDNFGVTSQTRRRTCISGQCIGGEFEQARSCLQTPQQDQPPISQNTWSGWSNWSSCSKSCGPGNFRTRARHCQCANAVALEQCTCIGENLERQECPNVPCCVHSPWSEWSACSSSCGPNGLRQRVRVCSCGEGADCDALGARTEQQPCGFSASCQPQRDDPCQNCVTVPTVPTCVNCNNVCSYCPVGNTLPCYTCLSRKKRSELLMEMGVIGRR